MLISASWRRIMSPLPRSYHCDIFPSFCLLIFMARLWIIVFSPYHGLMNSRLHSSQKKLCSRAPSIFLRRFQSLRARTRSREQACSSVQPIKPINELTRVNRYLIRRLASYRFAKLLFVRGCPRFWERQRSGRREAVVAPTATFHNEFSRAFDAKSRERKRNRWNRFLTLHIQCRVCKARTDIRIAHQVSERLMRQVQVTTMDLTDPDCCMSQKDMIARRLLASRWKSHDGHNSCTRRESYLTIARCLSTVIPWRVMRSTKQGRGRSRRS